MHTVNRLFCKPIKVFHRHEILYEKKLEELDQTLSFRSFDLATDLALIHNWVNQPYSKRFWQMDGNIDLLQTTYENILSSDIAHSFIGTLDKIPICLIDVYLICADELKEHIEASDDDCGLHLLMAPPRLLVKNLSFYVLREFLAFYFSFPMAKQIFAEPDSKNVLANKLAERVGFQFVKQIKLSYKTANLYSITKNQFHAQDTVS